MPKIKNFFLGLRRFLAPKIKKILKPIVFFILKLVYGSKKQINIGSLYKVNLDSRFTFSGWENWGTKHNNGFKALIKLADDADIVFDIGAHIGLCSIPMSLYSKVNKIYAFEPNALNRHYLNRHLAFNEVKNIEVFDLLIGERNEENIKLYSPNDVSGLPSIVNFDLINKKSLFHKYSLHNQVSLDHFCNQKQAYPDLIKIDVEGAEFNILRGATEVLSDIRPKIMLSLHPDHLKSLGEDLDFIWEVCSKYNYNIIDSTTNSIIKYGSHLKLEEYCLFPSSK